MGTDLTPKAEKLLAYIQKAGGGVLDEWYIRDKTGLSHGTICAARYGQGKKREEIRAQVQTCQCAGGHYAPGHRGLCRF